LAAQASIAVQNARLFAQVQAGQQRLRQLSKQVVSAQEEERQRISRELHDEAGQALTALKISLEMIKGGWQEVPGVIARQMDDAIEMTDQTMEQIRLLAHDLRPPVLDTFGLTTSLEGLCRDFGRRTNLAIEFSGVTLPELPEAVTISFYRFVQEALTNVARHADATEVKVELLDDGDKIIVTVTDNGKGFDAEAIFAGSERGGIGLMGMQDRFELLNGWVEIVAAPGQGTRVEAHVPYREEE
jgi:signal transduction histidine kinase